MTDQRLATVSRNLRAEGYLDNDPDATLAAIRLIALADALEAQQTDAPGGPDAENGQASSAPAAANAPSGRRPSPPAPGSAPNGPGPR